MANRPKLVMVSGSFPAITCGTSHWIKEITTRLVRRDIYDIHVLTSDDPKVNVNAVAGIHVHPSIAKWSYSKVDAISKRILSMKPDVVYIQNPTIKYSRWRSGLMSVLLRRLKKRSPSLRVVVMQHDLAISHPLFRWRYRPLLCGADAVLVTNSRDIQAARALGVEQEKLYRAPLSTHFKLHHRTAELKRTCRAKMHLRPEAEVVCFFGFVVPGRNVDVLIRSLHRLRQKGRDVHGLILGGAHDYAPAYYEKCQRLGRSLKMEDHLSWTGYASDEQVADGLCGSDVFVSLLDRGADLRNSSILTGILAQLPVITSENRRYYHDPDLDRLGCRCVAPRDVSAIAKAIEEVLDHLPSAQSLEQAADRLEPGRIWNHNIDMHLAAMKGSAPPEFR